MLSQSVQSYLHAMQTEARKDNVPSVGEHTGAFLYRLVRVFGAKSALEIGCARGYSTIWIAEAMKHNLGKLISFDFSRPQFEMAVSNIEELGLTSFVDLRFGNALLEIPKLTEQFDFVFVDGMKREYDEYFSLLLPFLSAHAILVFDNIEKFPEKTASFMNTIQSQNDFTCTVVPVSSEDSLLILTRLSPLSV